jgi:hypothetical protein
MNIHVGLRFPMPKDPSLAFLWHSHELRDHYLLKDVLHHLGFGYD